MPSHLNIKLHLLNFLRTKVEGVAEYIPVPVKGVANRTKAFVLGCDCFSVESFR